ncbi:hypothetical protein QG034_10710 [Kingella kingae]|uniref:hypothetical protein n=2 Tax=Kingella kingae TaxID=504 RepID=UPI0003F66846|nr:hypothetical protein [Kingella kingae]MDK4527308.1 hypothetical protein [Kingella kingae]MDK4533395.1 hypothetical protein [Kingella kingae]MDK4670459.1 hypothetical protein [Kingella kingae]
MAKTAKDLLIEQLNTGSLREVPLGKVTVFVKALSVAEMNAIVEQEARIDAGKSDFADEKKFALRVLDKDGKPFFDLDNQGDLDLIRAMPFKLRRVVDEAFFAENFGAISKNG